MLFFVFINFKRNFVINLERRPHASKISKFQNTKILENNNVSKKKLETIRILVYFGDL
jgi:hypothetical protein